MTLGLNAVGNGTIIFSHTAGEEIYPLWIVHFGVHMNPVTVGHAVLGDHNGRIIPLLNPDTTRHLADGVPDRREWSKSWPKRMESTPE